MLWATFLSFPLGFIGNIDGLVHSRNWPTSLGSSMACLRTADATTPFFTPRDVALTLVLFGAIYTLIFAAERSTSTACCGEDRWLNLPPGADEPSSAIGGKSPTCRPDNHALCAWGWSHMMTLANFWAAVLALSLLLYIVLDGFDLGVGILFGLTRDETARRHMLAAISPVWTATRRGSSSRAPCCSPLSARLCAAAVGVLFAALLHLAALILRGVAFEFRSNAGPGMRRIWDLGFAGGSFVAAFVQGATVGALVGWSASRCRRALRRQRDVRLVFTLCYPVRTRSLPRKCAAWNGVACAQERRRIARAQLSPAALALLASSCFWPAHLLRRSACTFASCTVGSTPLDCRIPGNRSVAVAAMLLGIRRRRDGWPFAARDRALRNRVRHACGVVPPYMVPFSITIARAAAPASSLHSSSGVRRSRPAADPALHDRRLCSVQRAKSSRTPATTDRTKRLLDNWEFTIMSNRPRVVFYRQARRQVNEPEAGAVFEPYESPAGAGAHSALWRMRFASKALC